MLSAQDSFITDIKEKIALAAPRHKLVTKYPYDSLWVHPPDPTMRKTLNVGDHHLRSVFVCIPELTHPQSLPDGRPPCPRCKTTHRVIIKGSTQKLSRRAIMRDACCDLLGYFYKCQQYEEDNKDKPKVGNTQDSLSFDPSYLRVAQ